MAGWDDGPKLVEPVTELTVQEQVWEIRTDRFRNLHRDQWDWDRVRSVLIRWAKRWMDRHPNTACGPVTVSYNFDYYRRERVYEIGFEYIPLTPDQATYRPTIEKLFRDERRRDRVVKLLSV